jgi:hypothetical protein
MFTLFKGYLFFNLTGRKPRYAERGYFGVVEEKLLDKAHVVSLE